MGTLILGLSTFLTFIGVFLVFIFCMSFIRAFIFTKAWTWLIVPLFNLPNIPFLTAWLLFLVLGSFTYEFKSNKVGFIGVFDRTLNTILNLLFTLLIVYIFKRFI